MEQWKKERLEARGYFEVSVQELLDLTPVEMALIELRLKLRHRRKGRLLRKRLRNFRRILGAIYKHG